MEAIARGIAGNRRQSYKHYTSLGRARDDLAADVVGIYGANIEMVDALAKAYGFSALFYWQSVIFTKGELTAYERAQREGAGEEMTVFFEKTYALVEEEEPELGDHFVNLSNIFTGVSIPLYIDVFHVSEAGNEMIVRRMAEDVIRLTAP